MDTDSKVSVVTCFSKLEAAAMAANLPAMLAVDLVVGGTEG